MPTEFYYLVMRAVDPVSIRRVKGLMGVVASSDHDVLQVCENGHPINSWSQGMPEFNKAFCTDCGAATIAACPKCNTPIRGSHREGMTAIKKAPKYCHGCGEPYPWQEAALENLHELAVEGGLSVEKQQELALAMVSVVSETPRTESATLKVKRLLGELGKPAYDIAIKVVSDIASGTAKKALLA